MNTYQIEQQEYNPTLDGCSFEEAMVYWNSKLKNCLSRLEDSGKNVTGKAVKLQLKNGSIVLQFSHPTEMSGNRRKQVNKSLGKEGNKGQLKQAYQVGEDTIEALVRGHFTNDWFDGKVEQYTGKKTIKVSNLTKLPNNQETEDKLTFKEAYTLLMTHFEKNKKAWKNPKAAYNQSYRRFKQWENNEDELTLKSLSKWFDSFNHSHAKCGHLLRFKIVLKKQLSSQVLEWIDDEIKQINKELKAIKNKKKDEGHKHYYLPNEKNIFEFYDAVKIKKKRTDGRKIGECYLNKRQRNLNLYAIMAIYGLRCHEAFNILNWDKPIVIENGQFLYFDEFSEDESNDDNYIEQINDKGNIVIDAINDPTNTQFLLAISHGKTGKRIAMPHNKEWLERFNLLGVNWDELLPDVKRGYNNNGTYKETHAHGNWLYLNECPFTSHKLRHFTNIKLHEKGINPKAIADSLGHLMTTNQSTYLQYQSANHKAQTVINGSNDNENEQNEITRLKGLLNEKDSLINELKLENERLKIQVKRLELDATF